MLNKIQKEQIKKALLQLDFSGKEADVYCSALLRSDSTVLTIANDTELSRGTVYDIIEKLKFKGYLAEIKKGKKRGITVESPTNKFYALLDAQHEQLQKTKKIVDDILPMIKSVNASEDFKPQIRVYSGDKGFRQVWDEIFAYSGKSWLSIARMETFVKFSGEDYLEEILKKKTKLGFISRAINENSPWARKMQSRDRKDNRNTRLMPKEFVFPSTEIIFGDKIAMFSTAKENTILVIESQDFAQTHRVYFEMLWKFLERGGFSHEK
ncbi:hypothetical protein KKC83_00260 [Patescibacteria group bacterium]|nr:hypothetical protein [Candidatus Falkowbacteria bacterium]MBU3906105.1 hypothetical protein [Patescibacteria group bacterium]MCG2698071.1 hypothetical protein [Candidatus Parcubacteria bacterium]MBU4014690.1 hypothetical protein [Patescibacteria group bacterium]MBU4025971.1 hypothetical protein [Patescibacteria group bacterium]